nr:gamma-glutamyltranspeptidase 3 [Tanacetum cinerariifolium]
GTSHFCIVDDDRNAVSLTTTVNYAFGGGVLSQSTGIVLNNEMGDFSVPTEVSSDKLPPSPSNFIMPNKRPLSSMTPIIILKNIQERIFDNTTFPSTYYMPRWSQLQDHGTSHFCIVDDDRNAVSLTTTVNYAFGGGVLSQSTGIVLNNEMGDFSVPTEVSSDKLPPSPSNFIMPNKRPLSSMTPIIILKNVDLSGVASYDEYAFAQVFINHFILGMDPANAVQSPRVYHKLIPNVVYYENWTVIDGDHIELSDDRKKFLAERGHELEPKAGGAICQLVIQTLKKPNVNRKLRYDQQEVLKGMLTAVSDPRKDGRPAAC